MVSYKGAFRMLKLIRYAMGTEAHKDTFEAIVEIDETYVGNIYSYADCCGDKEKVEEGIRRLSAEHICFWKILFDKKLRNYPF